MELYTLSNKKQISYSGSDMNLNTKMLKSCAYDSGPIFSIHFFEFLQYFAQKIFQENVKIQEIF